MYRSSTEVPQSSQDGGGINPLITSNSSKGVGRIKNIPIEILHHVMSCHILSQLPSFQAKEP